VSKKKLDPEAKKAVFDSTKQSISNLSLRKDGIQKFTALNKGMERL
jgi:hypothetical protein